MKLGTIEKIALILAILSGIVAFPSLFSIFALQTGCLFMWFLPTDAELAWTQHWRLILIEATFDIIFIASATLYFWSSSKIKMLKKAKVWEKEDLKKELEQKTQTEAKE